MASQQCVVYRCATRVTANNSIHTWVFIKSVRYFCLILIKFWIFWVDVRKSPQYQISRKSVQCDRADSCGQTDMPKQTGSSSRFIRTRLTRCDEHITTRRTEQTYSTTNAAVWYSKGSPFESMPRWQLKTGARLLPATSFQVITHYQTITRGYRIRVAEGVVT